MFRQGAGRLCLDFIRTLRHRGRPDVSEELPDPAALAAWIRQFGPVEPGPVDPAQVATAQELREAIHNLIQTARQGSGPATRARERVNAAAAQPVPAPHLTGSGQIRWTAADPVAALLSLLARDALDLVTSDSLARVRECAGADCGALFVDSSRPGTRRWCSMDTCGNRAKKETLRAKS